VLALMGGLVCLFQESETAGIVGVLVAIVLVPAAIVFGMRYFGQTPIGRRLILAEDPGDLRTVPLDPVRDINPGRLIGAEGVAVTLMRPVGACRFNGQRLECTAETGVIEAGQRVRITAVNGMEVRVKAIG
jgi:membrane-bound serine protease (ClpP class)